MLRISYCPYRLLFKRPFGTSHGERDGTDSLFIRIRFDGISGFGEVTLPPYVQEDVVGSMRALLSIAGQGAWELHGLMASLDRLPELKERPALRAGLHMALVDASSRKIQEPIHQLVGAANPKKSLMLMTLGICPLDEVPERLRELPDTGALKLKVGDDEGLARTQVVMASTSARILLDGNQGLRSVQEASELVRIIGSDRLLGFEQPFEATDRERSASLAREADCVIYADEAIQGLADLEAEVGIFQGVNLKLMKCGGLDKAAAMARLAQRQGKTIMLGSMSESSLGCTAMAHLSGYAECLDLDGPWLLRNDPWAGLSLSQGHLVMPAGFGLGVEPVSELPWIDA
jgi:L-alanine-DL-glutamate epimerase-like enolase superfamily enzyme